MKTKRTRVATARLQRLFLFPTLTIVVIELLASRFSSYGFQGRTVLQLETDGGFTNQVLDIAYVTTLAIAHKPCDLILPRLWSDGIQYNGSRLQKSGRVDFKDLFDLLVFKDFLVQHHVRLLEIEPEVQSSCHSVCRNDLSISKCVQLIDMRNRRCPARHIRVQAPFLKKIWSVDFLRSQPDGLFTRVLQNLKPSYKISSEVEKLHSNFFALSSKKKMCFVHARIEKDWQRHCLQWHPYPAGYSYDCYVSISDILEQSALIGSQACDIHITYDEDLVSPAVKEQSKYLAHRAGLKIIEPVQSSQEYLGREERAAIQFFLALRAGNFFGNSVSTLSAVIILLRQQNNMWSAQYNRGPVPLASFVPGYRIPWVFMVRGEDDEYGDMLKLAVSSANSHTSLMPHAIVHPSDIKQPIVTWLKAQNVTIIPHAPSWDEHVSTALHKSSHQQRQTSHLYTDVKATLATYFRLDIGNVLELSHVEHILYTDVDVYFRRNIDFFSQPLITDSIQMGFEASDTYPLNAGVYFASLKFLRETYAELLLAFLNSETVSDEEYGPGDQGVLNKVYARELRDNGPLSKTFNSKPYKSFLKEASIVHFHGPKLNDYAQYARSKSCRFHRMCAQGFEHGLCMYYKEIESFLAVNNLHIFRKEREILKRRCITT